MALQQRNALTHARVQPLPEVTDSPALMRELMRLKEENRRLKDVILARGQFIDSMNSLMEAVENPPSDVEIMDIMRDVLQNTLKAIHARDGSLLVRDEATNELVFALVEGDGPKGNILWRRLPAGQGIAGWVVENRRAAIVNNVLSDDRFYAKFDEEGAFRTRSVLAAPIIGGAQVLGVIEVLNKRDDMLFNSGDRARLSLICRVAGELLYRMFRGISLGAQSQPVSRSI